MACSITVSGRSFPCKDKIGGIKRVWIAQFEADEWGTIASGVIPGAGAMATVLLPLYSRISNSLRTRDRFNKPLPLPLRMVLSSSRKSWS